jgi:hypothetical protein
MNRVSTLLYCTVLGMKRYGSRAETMVQGRDFFYYFLQCNKKESVQSGVLGIRIRNRIRMFLGLPDPTLDPLVGGTDPDPDPAPDLLFSHMC